MSLYHQLPQLGPSMRGNILAPIHEHRAVQGTSCKLCHGPLSPSLTGVSHCHPHCLPLACTGCVQKDRPSFHILNMNNDESYNHCHMCTAEDVQGFSQPSPRFSASPPTSLPVSPVPSGGSNEEFS